MKTIELLPDEILLDAEWNSRQEYPKIEEEPEIPGKVLSEEQFERSISEEGILQPPRVRQLADGCWACVFGFRRVRAARNVAPDAPILCVVEPSTGDERQDDKHARFLNLSENLQRRSLKPWEVARALYQLKQSHPDLTCAEIARRTGLSEKYVANLIRFRAKAHPKIWKQFQKWGASLRIPFMEALEIVALPMERQMEAWNACVDEKRSTNHGKRGKQKRPGPTKLRKMLAAADNLKRARDYRRGVKFGLKVALGEEGWPT